MLMGTQGWGGTHLLIMGVHSVGIPFVIASKRRRAEPLSLVLFSLWALPLKNALSGVPA